MRHFNFFLVATATLTAPALAKMAKKIRVIMDEPCTRKLEGITRCMMPAPDRTNYIVECRNTHWHVIEKCAFEKPCINPPLDEAYCANDFEPSKDKCPEGGLCAINDQWTVEVDEVDTNS